MFKLLFLISSLTLSNVLSDCIINYRVECDQVTDYNELDIDNWQDLTIGSLDTEGTFSNDDLIYLYRDMKSITSLTIINRLKDKYIFLDTAGMENLRYYRLYGNNLETISSRDFYEFPNLIELNLQNNNIYYISGRRAYSATIEIVDFSHNQISDIEPEALINYRIRKLDLSHNALSSLPPKGFNSTIEILNLDYNQFTFIDENTISNLGELKELTLSNNGLAVIWDLTSHPRLQKIDFSFNQITRIQTNFNGFMHLRYQDFGFNKLRDVDFLSLIPKNSEERKISLAFNQLTQLQIHDWDYQPRSPVILTLFGNPWICRCLDETATFFQRNNFQRSKCDLQIVGSGKVPYCVAQDYCITRGARPNPKYFANFMKSITESKRHITCDVSKEMKKVVRKRDPLGKIGTAIAYFSNGTHNVFTEYK